MYKTDRKSRVRISFRTMDDFRFTVRTQNGGSGTANSSVAIENGSFTHHVKIDILR